MTINREGFWNNSNNRYPELPMPQPLPDSWHGKEFFIEALIAIEDSMNANEIHKHRGLSSCRLCNKLNGCAEYHTKEGWVWPSGYLHYIKEHNVRPSLAFQDFIYNKFIKIT